jgi:hypothetical protein
LRSSSERSTIVICQICPSLPAADLELGASRWIALEVGDEDGDLTCGGHSVMVASVQVAIACEATISSPDPRALAFAWLRYLPSAGTAG